MQKCMDSETADLRGRLEQIEAEIRKIGLDREEALRQVQSSQEIIDATPGDKEVRSRKLAEINAQIEELEKRLSELRQSRREIEDALAQLEERHLDAQRGLKAAGERIRRLEHDLGEKVRAKEDLRDQILRVRSRVLAEALRETEGLLQRYLSGRERLAEARRQLERLEKARREDPQVRDLWETVEEGEKILRSTGVRSLQEAVRPRVEEARREIEARFPGALSVPSGCAPDTEILEIYCAEVGKETWIFLPISRSTWEALRHESHQPLQEEALRATWGLSNVLREIPVRFTSWRDYMVLVADAEVEILDGQDGEIPLSDASSLTFLLTRAPRDLEEALCRENS